MRESPSSEMSLHGGLVKAADPHLDPHEETSGRKQWKHGGERVFQFQRKRSKTSRKRYFQNFSTLCNQQVGGSSPSTSSNLPQRSELNMGEFPSGQRGQTVNLLSVTSVVRIHLPPPKSALKSADFCFIRTFWRRTETADAACFCAGSLNSSSFHAAFVHYVRSRQLGLMSSTQRH